MNEVLTCKTCEVELTDKMELEYSQFVTEIFCSPDCAKQYYFEYMGSSPIDLTDKHELKDKGIRVVKGKIVGIK
ncbi:hypothetical protein PCURB6_27750 [Paenibacillus curdlanolyticus]|nr:hypothetical protein PCURB6_27750 [Paenibacillus curdlanolyticus]